MGVGVGGEWEWWEWEWGSVEWGVELSICF